MTRRSLTILALAAVSAFAASAAALAADLTRSSTPKWGAAIREWHLPAAGPNRLELVDKQVGIAQSASQYVDNTRVVTYKDIFGNAETTHSSRWTVVNATSIGVPPNAKALRLSLKGIITKGGANGLATVYVMLRPYESTCCPGPPGFEGYPVDHQLASGWQTETVIQTLAQTASDGKREWATVDVPLRDGKFEYAWGYRRIEGDWPAGDGVAFEMFANAYGR
jgi:hypothetical protein